MKMNYVQLPTNLVTSDFWYEEKHEEISFLIYLLCNRDRDGIVNKERNQIMRECNLTHDETDEIWTRLVKLGSIWNYKVVLIDSKYLKITEIYDTREYVQLSNDFPTSSLWQNGTHGEIRLWIWLLCQKNKFGIISQSVKQMSKYTDLSVDVIEKFLKKWQEPDPESRTKTDDGIRIRMVEGQVHLVNYRLFDIRITGDEGEIEKKRKNNAKYQAKWRAKKKAEKDVAVTS